MRVALTFILTWIRYFVQQATDHTVRGIDLRSYLSFNGQSWGLLVQTQKGRGNWSPFLSLGSIPRHTIVKIMQLIAKKTLFICLDCNKKYVGETSHFNTLGSTIFFFNYTLLHGKKKFNKIFKKGYFLHSWTGSFQYGDHIRMLHAVLNKFWISTLQNSSFKCANSVIFASGTIVLECTITFAPHIKWLKKNNYANWPLISHFTNHLRKLNKIW